MCLLGVKRCKKMSRQKGGQTPSINILQDAMGKLWNQLVTGAVYGDEMLRFGRRRFDLLAQL